MNKLLKLLIPLVLLFTLLFSASSAGAAPTIPPTQECIALTSKMLKKLPPYPSDARERKALKSLVDAGCIPKNPFSQIDPAPAGECQPYIDSAAEYLAPINAQAAASPRIRAVIKRAAKIEKRYNKKWRIEDRRLNKAFKKGNSKAIKKISKRMKVLENKKSLLKRKAVLSDPKIFNTYLANFYLVYLDLATNGCAGIGEYNVDALVESTTMLTKLAEIQ